MSIYTCTMNLAIDLFIETDKMIAKKVNRTVSSDIIANGKGVNVSLILKKLNIENHALGFAAGFTGRYIADTLENNGIQQSFIEVEGLTRINVFTKVNQTDDEFKLVNPGPHVPTVAQKQLVNQISQLQSGDYLVVSGSLPQGVTAGIILEMAQICSEKGVYLVLDVSDSVVMDCLRYHPYLLKPNEEELASWFDQEEIPEEELAQYAQELIQRGAQQVLLSLGDKGALFVDQNQIVYSGNAPKGKVVNTACAGDTLLATFLSGCIEKIPLEESLARSIAAGASTAFCSGLTDFQDVPQLEKQIYIKKEKSNGNI